MYLFQLSLAWHKDPIVHQKHDRSNVLSVHRLPALVDTPGPSPVETNFTSVERGSEISSARTEHVHATAWGFQTPSHHSIENEHDNESEDHDSAVELNSQDHDHLPEHTQNDSDMADETTSPSGPWHAGGAAF